MMREITGFGTDDQGAWIAHLACGHPQHVRHNPPFTNRLWVTSEAGRRSKIGASLDCRRCDAFEIPAAWVAYKRTQVFTEESVPAALRQDHTTKSGVWAKIVVVEGELRYHVAAMGTAFDLVAGGPAGIVLPQVPHRVEPLGRVRFFVEFYRAPAPDAC